MFYYFPLPGDAEGYYRHRGKCNLKTFFGDLVSLEGSCLHFVGIVEVIVVVGRGGCQDLTADSVLSELGEGNRHLRLFLEVDVGERHVYLAVFLRSGRVYGRPLSTITHLAQRSLHFKLNEG